MEPTVERDAQSALHTLERAHELHQPFSLVLTDAQLPEIDGFRLAEEICRRPFLPPHTMMMLTSSGRRGDAARCRELGIKAYLTKPIDQDELLEAILRTVVSQPEASSTTLTTRHSLREEQASLRILLVEDNLVNQVLATRLLEKHGHEVVLACNGREAISRIDGERFDLVLMDVQMPEMDGFETALAIRKKEKTTGCSATIRSPW